MHLTPLERPDVGVVRSRRFRGRDPEPGISVTEPLLGLHARYPQTLMLWTPRDVLRHDGPELGRDIVDPAVRHRANFTRDQLTGDRRIGQDEVFHRLSGLAKAGAPRPEHPNFRQTILRMPYTLPGELP